MSTTIIECSICFHASEIYYEIDEDDNPDLLPKHCPFCGYKEPEEDDEEDWDDIDDT
jgi:hypothetical protein